MPPPLPDHRCRARHHGARRREAAPNYASPDTTTIRMDSWVLTFLRARRKYHDLMRLRLWANPEARKEIRIMLRRKGKLDNRWHPFGNLDAPVEIQDKDSIQFVTVGSEIDAVRGLDDMVCALGRFTFRVVLEGSVERVLSTRSTHEVKVRRVGVYVKDSYDFNGSQFLGFWSDLNNTASAINPSAGFGVDNGDFRAWRSLHSRGGDFEVFSDVKKTRITRPVKVIV